jgi:hypothetical protein
VDDVLSGKSKLTELTIDHIALGILKDLELNLKFVLA